MLSNQSINQSEAFRLFKKYSIKLERKSGEQTGEELQDGIGSGFDENPCAL